MVFYTKLSSHMQHYMKYDPLDVESPIEGEDALKTGEFLSKIPSSCLENTPRIPLHLFTIIHIEYETIQSAAYNENPIK